MFGCVSLSGDMSCVEVDLSRTITIFCCSVRPMFSVWVVSCLWLSVVHVSMLFLFFTADIYTFIYFTLFLKGFFI